MDHDGTAGRQHKRATDIGEASNSFQPPDICRPVEQLPSTAQTAPSADDLLPGNTPAAIGATRRSLSGHEPPPAKRRASPSLSLGSWERGAINTCEGFKGGECRDMPASHSFLVTAVQMSQASEATGTLGRLSVDGVKLAEPHAPLWFATQVAAVGAPLFTEVEAGTQQNYDGRFKLGAMSLQQPRVARAAMWQQQKQQQQQQQSAAGGCGGPPQFAGMWP